VKRVQIKTEYHQLLEMAPAFGVRGLGIPLANGTVQGAVATWRLPGQLLTSPPGRYRSLYRTGLPNSPAVSLGTALVVISGFYRLPGQEARVCFLPLIARISKRTTKAVPSPRTPKAPPIYALASGNLTHENDYLYFVALHISEYWQASR
jgi:hypothetical protein